MKKLLFIMIAIALIYIALCGMGPSVIKIERSEVINAKVDDVKFHITDYNNRIKWLPLQGKHNPKETIIEGEPGKIGQKYSWKENEMSGNGTTELTFIGNDTVIEKFDLSGKGISDVYFIFKSEGNTTKLTWIMNMNIGFFDRGLTLFMKNKMNNILGSDLEKGLQKIKSASETLYASYKIYKGYEIKELNWDQKTFYGKKAYVQLDKLDAFFADNFSKIKNDFEKKKISRIGGLCSIYFNYNEFGSNTECAAAAEVPSGTEIKGWEKIVTPASLVLQITYFGDIHRRTKDPNLAMDEYMKEKGLTQTLVIEEYVTDQMVERDPRKWQTNIFYLVKNKN